MSDLKFDLEAFRKAAHEYVTLAGNMEELRVNLETNIQNLVESEWVSDASKAFMEQYQSTWSDNVKEYITFLKYMEELMNTAEQYYTCLADHVESVEFPNY